MKKVVQNPYYFINTENLKGFQLEHSSVTEEKHLMISSEIRE